MKGKPLKPRVNQIVRWTWTPSSLPHRYCSVTGERHTLAPHLWRRRKTGGRKLRCGACGVKLPAELVAREDLLG